MSLAEAINDVLPQTQCTRCGYDGCRPYAEAIVRGEAGINQCPPGGTATIAALAGLTGREAVALDPACGEAETQPFVAFIDEARCIGCYKCVQACPVDAIVGAPKLMHTVIDAECTGCELCLPPCPVDCIEWRPRQTDALLGRERAARSRQRYEAHETRLSRQAAERESARRQRRNTLQDEATMDDLLARIQARARTPRG